jgi:hypothetical protein
MKLSPLLEVRWQDVPDHVYRGWALKLQQELIDLLPDDYDVNLTDIFLYAGLYTYGKSALRIRHSSFKDIIANGEVMVFPRDHGECVLIYTYKQSYESSVSYPNAHQLATDLEKNIQTNSV